MAIASEVVVGTAPVITASFTDVSGAAADPDTVAFRVKEPDDTETTYTTPDPAIANPSVGTYVLTFPTGVTQVGPHWVYCVGSGGTSPAANEIGFAATGVNVTVPVS